MSELAWSKAARLLSLDHDAGWPLLLDLRRLAELQAGKETKEQRDEARDIEATLLRACKAGTLPCEAHESPIRTRYAVVHRPAVAEGWGDELLHGFRDVRVTVGPAPRPKPALKATIYRLSPATFAIWLAGEGLTPSPLAAAWFKATGATATTPPRELVQRVAGVKEVEETVGDRNIRWHLEYEREKLSKRELTLAEMARRIGSAEGQKVDTVRKGMRAGKTLHADKYKRGEVPQSPSVGAASWDDPLRDPAKKGRKRPA